jgi:iron complex transport system substrate-binding protein
VKALLPILLAMLLAPASGLAASGDAGPPPQRIAALAPHLVEMLYALGVGERLVATVSHADHPPAAHAIPRVGDAFSVSLETLAARRPDVVLAWAPALAAGRRERLDALGVRLWVSDPRTLEDVAAELEALAALTGGDAAAAGAFRADLDRLRARAPNGVRVLPLVSTAPPMALTDGDLVGDLIAHCGAGNPVGDAPGAVVELSRERLLTVDADLVLLLTPTKAVPERLRLPRQARVVHLDPDRLVRPGPRLADGLAALCAEVAAEARP